jgi:hypothetical protein
MVRRKAGVRGRWHDNRHTLITELAESGAGDETILEIAGHVSRQMLSRYPSAPNNSIKTPCFAPAYLVRQSASIAGANLPNSKRFFLRNSRRPDDGGLRYASSPFGVCDVLS